MLYLLLLLISSITRKDKYLHQSAVPCVIKVFPIFFLGPSPGLTRGLDLFNKGIKYLTNYIICLRAVGVAFIMKLEISAYAILLNRLSLKDNSQFFKKYNLLIDLFKTQVYLFSPCFFIKFTSFSIPTNIPSPVNCTYFS